MSNALGASAIQDRSLYLDWEVVTDAEAADAIEALLTVDRMAQRWDDLPPASRELHRDILAVFLRSGPIPRHDELASRSGTVLSDILERDLVFRDGDLVGAYPFACRDTGHRVTSGGASWWPVCAIDAFGIAAMIERPAQIETACPVCNRQLMFQTDGSAIKTSQDALVWASMRDTGGCAANTQCKTMRAICSDAHAKEWAASDEGYRLTIPQAAQIGTAIFGPGSAFGRQAKDALQAHSGEGP